MSVIDIRNEKEGAECHKFIAKLFFKNPLKFNK